VSVAPDPAGDGREQLLDLLLLGGRLDHAPPVGSSLLPQVALVGFLDPGKFPVDGDLDAEFVQVGE
jgi:hypothetical protein